MKRTLLIGALVVLAQPMSAPAAAGRGDLDPAPPVDEIFSKWTSSTPGCAVGVAVGGKPVLLKAYGMADLEHDVRNTPDTIFEAGSVSKQFTAMAVQLLAGEGKLSLDDPVRKYIPELPDYGKPLTIRHMLIAHQRPARLGQRRKHRRLAAHDARIHARARARHRVAAEVAQLRSGHEVVVQQHRLQPCRDHRVARQRHAVRGVLEAAHLRAARHDAHLLARRSHAHRQGPRDRLLARRTASTTSRCRSRTCTATAGC